MMKNEETWITATRLRASMNFLLVFGGPTYWISVTLKQQTVSTATERPAAAAEGHDEQLKAWGVELVVESQAEDTSSVM